MDENQNAANNPRITEAEEPNKIKTKLSKENSGSLHSKSNAYFDLGAFLMR